MSRSNRFYATAAMIAVFFASPVFGGGVSGRGSAALTLLNLVNQVAAVALGVCVFYLASVEALVRTTPVLEA